MLQRQTSPPQADRQHAGKQKSTFEICSNYIGGDELTNKEIINKIQDKLISNNGTYLPLIIRLAILLNPADYESISDLFRETLRQLLSSQIQDRIAQDETIVEASDFCKKTYWKDGRRILLYADNNTAFKKTMKKLYESGILIPVDSHSTGKIKYAEPKTVKFIHDSFQTYLTCRALLNENEISDLKRMAGDPIFLEKKEGSDLYYSEIYNMFIELYSFDNELIDVISKELISWGKDFDMYLTKNLLTDFLKSGLIDEGEFKVNSFGVLIENLINNKLGKDIAAYKKEIFFLYGQMAPVIFSLNQAN